MSGDKVKVSPGQRAAWAREEISIGGLPLPGWTCANKACGIFNGAAKELRLTCRGCGSPKPRKCANCTATAEPGKSRCQRHRIAHNKRYWK